MVIELAPRRPPEFRRTWLAIALLFLTPLPGFGQQPKPGDTSKPKAGTSKTTDSDASKAATKDADGPDAAKDEREKTGVVETKAGPKVEPVEIFTDPRAKAALAPSTELFSSVFPKADDDKAIDGMATGSFPVDKEIVTRYVQTQLSRLTKKVFVEAMVNPDAKSADARQFDIATNKLMKPLLAPAGGQNAAFRRFYIDQLVANAPDLLKNNLFAREAIMIVLSESGDLAALPIYIKALEDADQLLQVKERSAVGIFKIAKSGLLTGKPLGDSAAALSEFLKNEPEAFYFVKLRVLEALGALRVASALPARGQPEVSIEIFKLLADPKEKLDVRVYAAHALGMIQPGSISGYNYPLVAHQIAQAAVDVGRRLVDIRETQPLKANRLTVFLMLLVEALSGDPAVTGSGIARANPDAAAPYEAKVKAVFAASVDYCRALRSQTAAKKKALAAAVDDLKATIDKKMPADRALTPQGDPLAIAGVPAADGK